MTILSYGFRPFFLLAGLFATAAIPIMLAFDHGGDGAPGAWLLGAWHGHEMIFGYAAAVLAAFLLTAVPNWTGAEATRGRRLGMLVGLWVIGRLAMLLAGHLPPVAVAAADGLFLLAVMATIGPPLLGAEQRRNAVLLVPIGLLFLANLTIHLDAADVLETGAFGGLSAAVHLFALLITVIGGRIVPSFTINALRQTADETGIRDNPVLARLSILGMVLIVVADVIGPVAEIRGALGLAVAAVIGLRMASWGGWRTRRQPILWILHVAYAWLPIGLALEAMSRLTDVLPMSGALHGLTIGAIGTMTLAMMSRVTLGHTGRPLVLPPWMTVSYVAITIAAIARIVAPLFDGAYELLVMTGTVAWILAFAIFCLRYGPILTGPRADGKPG